MKISKVFNDPVHGFIPIKSKTHLEIIDHPYFQKLRRIRQLGLTDFVYPGAVHTRFHHALGAMFLMGKALDILRIKGIEISDEEYYSCQFAILLHDIGHGPFSHSLEEVLMPGISHESLSFLLMQQINHDLNGKLNLAVKMFQDGYERSFFHSLISSQLDTDRMDYIVRDSYFTGVPEGKVSIERIIQLLNVKNDQLVAEEKAVYPIENFINARRLMYWQVYLHKTSVGAEKLITNILKRARDVYRSGQKLPMTEALEYFIRKDVKLKEFNTSEEPLHYFSQLDDSDLWGSIKLWKNHSDRILSILSKMILNRHLYHMELSNEPINKEELQTIKRQVAEKMDLLQNDTHYFVCHGKITNEAYVSGGKGIQLLMKTGETEDISDVADLPNIKAMSKIVTKYYQCRPKDLNLQTYY